MTLKLITPRTARLDIETGKVFFPGVEGKFEVLKNHAPMVAALCEGDIIWEDVQGGQDSFHISSGFVEIKDNELTVAAEE